MMFKCFTALFLVTGVAYADFWRFTLNKFQCIEPREWKTDRVRFRMNVVTKTPAGAIKQNVTTDRGAGLLVNRGDRSDDRVMWKDVMLDSGDEALLFTFTAWNQGDKDPQKIGLEIAQLVLKIVRGNLALNVIASAISFVIDQFKDAYDCAGPVILSSIPYSQSYLMGMPYNQPICTTRPYNFETKGGCIDSQPFNLEPKVSRYVAEDCVERLQGAGTGGGEANTDYPSGTARLRSWVGFMSSEAIATFLVGWMNML